MSEKKEYIERRALMATLETLPARTRKERQNENRTDNLPHDRSVGIPAAVRDELSDTRDQLRITRSGHRVELLRQILLRCEFRCGGGRDRVAGQEGGEEMLNEYEKSFFIGVAIGLFGGFVLSVLLMI